MIQLLRVQNFALIEAVEVRFGKGLNILTGETGAGKSLLIGALGLILGRRADSSQLNPAGGKCIVEAEFDLREQSQLLERFSKEDWYEPEAGPTLIVRREISASGKSRAFIQDTPVNLHELRTLAEELIDLHGQHEGTNLMDPAKQLSILDRYAGLTDRIEAFGKLFSQYRKAIQQAQHMREQETEARRRSDYLAFQVKELNTAQLTVEEEEDIDRELNLLHHAEHLGETLQQAVSVLNGADDAVSQRLAEQQRLLEKSANLHPALPPEVAKIEQARILIEDAARELETLGESIDLDPRRLSFLDERQATYHRLKLKYGARDARELLVQLSGFEQELETIGNLDERISILEDEARVFSNELLALGRELTSERKSSAEELQSQVESTLREVGLLRAELRIEIRPLAEGEGLSLPDGSHVRADGLDAVQMLIRTNVGMPLGALGSIASGGELSRVMLAIKAALAARMDLSVLIFDEIDTGISGEIALKVGRVMENIALKHQLLVITHLPQIASRGEHHFFIYKEAKDERTVSNIRELSREERVQEVAKIMSGENPTTNALQSAWELLSLDRRLE